MVFSTQSILVAELHGQRDERSWSYPKALPLQGYLLVRPVFVRAKAPLFANPGCVTVNMPALLQNRKQGMPGILRLQINVHRAQAQEI